MCETNNAPTNVEFFPHFKLCFKLCQMAIIIRRRDHVQKKMEASEVDKKEIQTKMETSITISENLNFHNELTEEAERMRNGEIDQLE